MRNLFDNENPVVGKIGPSGIAQSPSPTQVGTQPDRQVLENLVETQEGYIRTLKQSLEIQEHMESQEDRLDSLIEVLEDVVDRLEQLELTISGSSNKLDAAQKSNIEQQLELAFQS